MQDSVIDQGRDMLSETQTITPSEKFWNMTTAIHNICTLLIFLIKYGHITFTV